MYKKVVEVWMCMSKEKGSWCKKLLMGQNFEEDEFDRDKSCRMPGWQRRMTFLTEIGQEGKFQFFVELCKLKQFTVKEVMKVYTIV